MGGLRNKNTSEEEELTGAWLTTPTEAAEAAMRTWECVSIWQREGRFGEG